MPEPGKQFHTHKGSPGTWRHVRRLLRVLLPLAFVLVTVWTVVDLVQQGPLPPAGRAQATPATSPDGGVRDQDAVRVAVAADIGSDAQARTTLSAMARHDVDLHLALGDLSYAGPGSERAWCDLVRSEVGPVVPFQVLAGNHEEDTGEDGRIAGFAACLPDRLNAVGEYARQYWFDVGSRARFIMISPDLTIDGKHYYYGKGSPGERWLVQAIDSARARGAQWVVVGMHKNCLSTGEYYCRIYQDLLDLLVEKRVDLVLHGHEHNYQRTKQVATDRQACPQVTVDGYDPDCVVDDGSDGTYARGAGPVFVVAGTAGGRLYPVHPGDPEAGYFARTMGAGQDARHGFVALDLRQEELSVEFVPSSPGRFTDAFRITGPVPVRPCTFSGQPSGVRAVVVPVGGAAGDFAHCAARQSGWTPQAVPWSDVPAQELGPRDVALVVVAPGETSVRQAARTARDLRKRHPQVRIVLVGPLGLGSEDLEPERDHLRGVTVDIGAEFIDPVRSRWLADHPQLVGPAGLRPDATPALGDLLARALARGGEAGG